jgi:hypothetical protein
MKHEYKHKHKSTTELNITLTEQYLNHPHSITVFIINPSPSNPHPVQSPIFSITNLMLACSNE